VVSCAIVQHTAIIAGFKTCNYCSMLHATTARNCCTWNHVITLCSCYKADHKNSPILMSQKTHTLPFAANLYIWHQQMYIKS